MPRPICFVVMPYGRKPSLSTAEDAPATIDFDALWEKAFMPLLEEDLGYEAVRADQDAGALIIHEMIQRLALADIIIADVTSPNGNVYYEIGVRHAAKEHGCVLISADWSKPLFDIAQMRSARYPLPRGTVTDDDAAAIRGELRQRIPPLLNGRSPVFEALPGFPAADMATASTFRQQMEELSRFHAAVRAVRLMPEAERAARALALRDRYSAAAVTLSAVALELMYLLRDCGLWDATIDFIDGLAEPIRTLPTFREQRCLVESRRGSHLEAIAALEELIRISGDSSERRGLLGGRYKKLYREATDARLKATYLDRAIEQYHLGMGLDLNDYYPTSNLPRLLRRRGDEGDEDRAHAAAAVTVLACERAQRLNPQDPWVRPTMLGAAFDAGDVATARRLATRVRREGIDLFHLDTTLPDLEEAVELLSGVQDVTPLRAIIAELRLLMLPPADAAPIPATS